MNGQDFVLGTLFGLLLFMIFNYLLHIIRRKYD